MIKLIEQLELALDKLDAAGEQIAAIKLDECILILCNKHKIKRKRAPMTE